MNMKVPVWAFGPVLISVVPINYNKNKARKSASEESGMKPINFILILLSSFFLFACSTTSPIIYNMNLKEAKMVWDSALSELENTCLNTKGIKVPENTAPSGKLYKYACEIRKYQKKGYETADWFTGYKYKRARGGGQMIFPEVKKHFFATTGVKTIWTARPHYVSWIDSYVMQNGYTFLTIGQRDPAAAYKGQRYYVYRIEGYSSGPSPTLDEIYGRKIDLPISSLTSVMSGFKSWVKSNHRREESIQLSHNSRVDAIRNARSAEIKRRNRENNRIWGQEFQEYRRKMLGGNAQDQQFLKAYGQAGKIGSQTRSRRSVRPRSSTANTPSRYGRVSTTKKSSRYGGSTGATRKNRNLENIACLSRLTKKVNTSGFGLMLNSGTIAAGGPFCAHFHPKSPKKDCSGYKAQHAGDFKLHGDEFCKKLRGGMTFKTTMFTSCNCGINDANQEQCRLLFKQVCQ